MIISIFKNWTYTIWIDYWNNKNISNVFNINEIEKEKIENWCDFEIIKSKLIITETSIYKKYLLNTKINKINQDFNKKISNYNSKYPIEEQKRFADKLIKAEKVIAWWTDKYISKKSKSLWITTLQFAEVIKSKADLFEDFYTTAEIERDTLLGNLK